MGSNISRSLDTLFSGKGEISKFVPYILGLVIGTVFAAVLFDTLHPNYKPSRLGS